MGRQYPVNGILIVSMCAVVVSCGCGAFVVERLPESGLPRRFSSAPKVMPERDVPFTCVLTAAPYLASGGVPTILRTEVHELYASTSPLKNQLYSQVQPQCAEASELYLQRRCASKRYSRFFHKRRPMKYVGNAVLFINGGVYSQQRLVVQCSGEPQASGS